VCRITLYSIEIYSYTQQLYFHKINWHYRIPSRNCLNFSRSYSGLINPLNAELNPICHFLALLGAHHILHVSRIRVNKINAYESNRLSSDPGSVCWDPAPRHHRNQNWGPSGYPSIDSRLLEYIIRSKTGWNMRLTPLCNNTIQNSYCFTSTLLYIYCQIIRQRQFWIYIDGIHVQNYTQ